MVGGYYQWPKGLLNLFVDFYILYQIINNFVVSSSINNLGKITF